MFQYTRSGYYSVFKVDNDSYTALRDWAPSAAIVQGAAWNTLRVVASGTSLKFYINGTLVWSGSDGSFTAGRVGIGLYRSADSTGDQLWVDWATLSTPAAASALDAGPTLQDPSGAAREQTMGDVNMAPSDD
jgi:hypothetical protein